MASAPLPTSSVTVARRRRLRLVLIGALLVVAAVLGVAGRARSREAALLRADPETILADPRLRAIALPRGKDVFAAHCSACHGVAGKGDQLLGVPDLSDDEILFGIGRVAEIEGLARHGIRAHDTRGANLATMPAYAQAVPYAREPLPPLTPAQIEDLTQSLLWFIGRQTDLAAAKRGRTLFTGAAGCWDCHSGDGGGDPAIGAPGLTDSIWLYGGSHDAIYRSIARGRAGMSPAFGKVLSAADLRAVAVYVASLAPTKAGS